MHRIENINNYTLASEATSTCIFDEDTPRDVTNRTIISEITSAGIYEEDVVNHVLTAETMRDVNNRTIVSEMTSIGIYDADTPRDVINHTMVSEATSTCIFADTPRDEEVNENNEKTPRTIDETQEREDSCRSSVISSYLKDVFTEAKGNIINEKKLKHAPHPPSTPFSQASRSSSTISHYLNNVITNTAQEINKGNRKLEKKLTFAKLNTSTISTSSITSSDLQNYVGDIIMKCSNDIREETNEDENDKLESTDAGNLLEMR